MTILALRKQHPDDAEFLDLPEVRKVYWKAVGIRSWEHKIVPLAMQLGVPSTVCQKCRKDGVGKCTVPDPIPPLLKAVENAREAWRTKGEPTMTRAAMIELTGQSTQWRAYVWIVEQASLVEQLCAFLAALMEDV